MNRRFAGYLLLLAALAMLAACCVVAHGQEWEWSPPAPYHAAVVRVQAGANGGSGVYIALGGSCAVLTAAHVIQPNRTATVFWSDGTQSQGATRADKYQHDVGMVLTAHPSIPPLELADADPEPGSRVEFVTYGGPENRLRSFWSAFERERQLVGGSDCLYTVAVSSGDSGGAILDSSHRVVGIVSGGRTASVNGDGWPVHRGSVSAPRGPIRAFVGRVFGCQPQGCPPRRQGPILEWQRGGSIQFYPPRRQEPPPVLPGPGDEPPDEPAPIPHDEIAEDDGVTFDPVSRADLSAINVRLDALAAAIAAIPAGRTGDTGQQGARGLPGPKGDKGELGPVPGVDYVPNLDNPMGRFYLNVLTEAVVKRLPPMTFDPATLTDKQAAAWAAKIQPKLDPMTFQARTPNGELYGEPVPKRLGETVFLKTPKGD
uniref:Putative trypsin-like peptidase domain containing protein n=1 Tax=viral metagenome TaxID=1070528 RepID=A0A6H1ZQV9_9ZZZZ